MMDFEDVAFGCDPNRQIADAVVRWISERTATGSVIVAVCHAIEPLVRLVNRALTVREGSIGILEELPLAPEARLRLLDTLARGKV